MAKGKLSKLDIDLKGIGELITSRHVVPKNQRDICMGRQACYGIY